ncbi:MAG: hypothetical protein ACJ8A0_19155 [Microvirga sp.]
MTDEVANLVLEQLRLIRADIQRIDGKVDAVASELGEVKSAVTGLPYITAHALGEIQDVKGRVDRLES